MNYYEILKGLKENIDQNPQIEIVETEIMGGFAEKYLNNLCAKADIKPSADMIAFYTGAGSFRLTWRLKNESGIVHHPVWPTIPFGNINILAIDEYISNDTTYQVPLEDNKTLYYFDYYNTDSQEGTCLMAENGIIQPQLYLTGLEIGLVETTVTIPQYINKLIQNKGFMFWQRGLNDPDSIHNKQVSHYIPQLFKS